jgi:GNAT superfamily N-acetyltransferase
VTIRGAHSADAPAIAQLHAESWRVAYRGILRDDFLDGPVFANRRELWETRLCGASADVQITLVSEHRGAIQAFACAFLDADPEWGTLLDNLYVVPGLKGKGVGSLLMSAVAERVLLHRPRSLLHLWVYEQNVAARRFYERLGGLVTASHAEAAPDGARVNAIRYGWRDVAGLVGRIAPR